MSRIVFKAIRLLPLLWLVISLSLVVGVVAGRFAAPTRPSSPSSRPASDSATYSRLYQDSSSSSSSSFAYPAVGAPPSPQKTHLWRWPNRECLGEPLLLVASWTPLENTSNTCSKLIANGERVIGYVSSANAEKCPAGEVGSSWTLSMHTDSSCRDTAQHTETFIVGKCTVSSDDPSSSYFLSCFGPPSSSLLPPYVQLKWTYHACPWNSEVKWFLFDTFRNAPNVCVPWHGPTFRGMFAWMHDSCNSTDKTIRFSIYNNYNCTSWYANVTLPLGDACEWKEAMKPRTTCFLSVDSNITETPTSSAEIAWKPGNLSGGAIAGIVIVCVIVVASFAAILISNLMNKKPEARTVNAASNGNNEREMEEVGNRDEMPVALSASDGLPSTE